MKVLVVDDDPVILTLTEAVLKGLGHDVITRDNALGTSAEIYRERPDVALVDLEMPGISGEEIVKIAQLEEFDTPEQKTAYIFYSGRDREELDRLVAETGAAGAIDKGSGPTGLAKQFNAIIEKL